MNNYFWCDSSRGRWQADRSELVFLGRAVCRIGAAIFGGDWRDDDFVHQGAPLPSVPSFGAKEEDWLDNLLKRSSYDKAAKAHAAGERAAVIADRILEGAEKGTLKVSSRPIQGGDFKPAPSDWWDRRRSLHIFRSCTFSPLRPFAETPPIKEQHHVFVERVSVNGFLRTIPGGFLAQVSDPALRGWVVTHTGQVSSRDELIELSKKAFPNNITPARDRVVNVDKEVREALGLAPRTRGRPPGR